MNKIEVIKYLLDEIEKEENYNLEHGHERERAERKAEIEQCEHFWEWRKFMPCGFDREPRMSIIKANAKKIRQLLLKFY